MKKTIGVMLCASLLGLAGAALAQDFPDKPLRLIVPYPPGGGTDRLARPIAEQLSEALHQQVIVDNRGGANGTIGMDIAAKAPADGYTMVLALTAQLAINPGFYKKLPYDPVRDYAPIALLGSSPYLLTAHPSLPAQSVKDLIALAKARPGKIAFSSSGTGGIPHLAGEMLNQMAGMKLLHVPYKGGGPALRDLIAGQVQLNFAVISAAYPYVKSGQIRALAVTSARRSPVMPEVPTVAETLPGYEVSTWFGILAPARTPKAIVTLLNREIVHVLDLRATKSHLPFGFDPSGSTPQYFQKYIASEIAKWARVLRASGIKPR